MPAMMGSDTMNPIRSPATTIIVPEVITVGNARFIVSMMDWRGVMVSRS